MHMATMHVFISVSGVQVQHKKKYLFIYYQG